MVKPHVFRHGDPVDGFYVITKGSCAVTVPSSDGQRNIATLQAGDFFGETGMLEGRERRAASRPLAIGESVVLTGLAKAPEYNGLSGVVVLPLNGAGRHVVRVDGSKKTLAERLPILLYPPNLVGYVRVIALVVAMAEEDPGSRTLVNNTNVVPLAIMFFLN